MKFLHWESWSFTDKHNTFSRHAANQTSKSFNFRKMHFFCPLTFLCVLYILILCGRGWSRNFSDLPPEDKSYGLHGFTLQIKLTYLLKIMERRKDPSMIYKQLWRYQASHRSVYLAHLTQTNIFHLQVGARHKYLIQQKIRLCSHLPIWCTSNDWDQKCEHETTF